MIEGEPDLLRLPLHEKIGKTKVMERNIYTKTKLAGVEPAITLIAKLVTNDTKVKSGIFGLNDKLELIYTKRIYNTLNNSKIFHILARLENDVTAVVLFAVFDKEPFSVSKRFIRKMVSFCEATQISLLDIIFYSPQGSASLRQQNLL